MKRWEELTERGQAHRARTVVERALPAYGLAGSRIRLLEVASNIVYRIDARDGERFVMKVDVQDEHPDQHLDLALEWLAALNAETDLPLVELVPTMNGAAYAKVDAPHVPPGRRCVVYRWVRGRTVFDAPGPEHYRQLGVLTARLHEHASEYTPSAPPNRWDRVFYFPLERVVIDDPEFAGALDVHQRDLVHRSIEAVSPVLASLYDTPGRMIHADLHGWNVNAYRGRLTLLDFDDVMWGQPVHDIAITFGYHRNHDAYREWIAAYEEGYRTVAPWPVQDESVVMALMVARRLMFTNYVLQLPGDWSEELATWMEMFEDYLEGGG